MRRPAAFLCGAYILGMATEFCLKLNYTIVLVMVGLCVLVIKALLHGRKHVCLLLVALMMFFMGAFQFYKADVEQGTLQNYRDQYMEIDGVVVLATEKDSETHKLLLEVERIGEMDTLPKKEKILINLYGEYPDYYKLQGRSISVTGFIEIPEIRRNPRTFDYKQYLKTKGIHVIMGIPVANMQVSEGISNKYLNTVSQICYIFKCNIKELFDEEVAGLLMGMMFGDNSGLSEDTYESFQKNGICHVLAVSGLHIGALYGCINAAVGGNRRLFVNIIVIMSLVFYASLANFSPSVIRAVIMIAFHIASKFLYCKYDMFTSGVITMLIMTVGKPMLLLNLGFQLSFLAIFTLAVIMPAAMRLYDKWITGVFVIQAGMVPISAFAFNYFSFSAFIANIPVIFLAGILIPLGMLLLLLSTASAFLPLDNSMLNDSFTWLFQIIGIITEFFSELLLYINQIAFIKGISFQYVTSPPLWGIFFYYGALFFISTEGCRIWWQRKHYKKMICAAVGIIFISFIFGATMKSGFEKVQFTFVDVGQGDCLHIKTAEGKNVLIDTGGSSQYDVGKKLLLPYLLKNGVKEVDMVLVTHLHKDHVGGLETLSREIPIKKVGIYDGNRVKVKEISKQLGMKESNFVYLKKGQNLKFGKELEIEILYPEEKSLAEYEVMMADGKDENAASLVMKVTYDGVSVIMTGDVDNEGERKVLDAQALHDGRNENMEATILKVAHHGSKYGSSHEFLEAVKPKLAVVQVGKNNTYGHPNEETLTRIKDRGTFIYRNDVSGAIGVEIKKDGNIKIHTMI